MQLSEKVKLKYPLQLYHYKEYSRFNSVVKCFDIVT